MDTLKWINQIPLFHHVYNIENVRGSSAQSKDTRITASQATVMCDD